MQDQSAEMSSFRYVENRLDSRERSPRPVSSRESSVSRGVIPLTNGAHIPVGDDQVTMETSGMVRTDNYSQVMSPINSMQDVNVAEATGNVE